MVDNRYVSHTATIISSLVGLGLIQGITGRSDDATSTIKQLMDYAVESRDPANLLLAESGSARIKLLQGETSDGPISEDTEMATAFLFLEVPTVSQCRVLIARGSEQDLMRALDVLEALQESAELLNNTYHLIDILVLKTIALHKLGQVDSSHQMLDVALGLAAAGGWVRPFVETGLDMIELLQAHPGAQAQTILKAFPQAPTEQPQETPHLIDSLTHREQDVLEGLAERLYDKEIAEKLSVSLSTVKTHLRHIYEKLGARNRREAISIAERLGLLK